MRAMCIVMLRAICQQSARKTRTARDSRFAKCVQYIRIYLFTHVYHFTHPNILQAQAFNGTEAPPTPLFPKIHDEKWQYTQYQTYYKLPSDDNGGAVDVYSLSRFSWSEYRRQGNTKSFPDHIDFDVQIKNWYTQKSSNCKKRTRKHGNDYSHSPKDIDSPCSPPSVRLDGHLPIRRVWEMDPNVRFAKNKEAKIM